MEVAAQPEQREDAERAEEKCDRRALPGGRRRRPQRPARRRWRSGRCGPGPPLGLGTFGWRARDLRGSGSGGLARVSALTRAGEAAWRGRGAFPGGLFRKVQRRKSGSLVSWLLRSTGRRWRALVGRQGRILSW